MDEQGFERTPVGQAFRAYNEYMAELHDFMRSHRVSYAVLFVGAQLAPQFTKNLEDARRHEPLFHALIVIGAWSALEAYVADFCIAVMREQPVLLDSDEIQSIKVPIAELLVNDDDKTERVYYALAQNFGRGAGVRRYESILKLLGLSERVPEDIRRAILKAQKIRNVWAHNAGRADSQFLKNSIVPSFELGDKVEIDGHDVNYYVDALRMYGNIITSRWRVGNGLEPCAPPEDSPFKESYESIYPPKPTE